MQLLNKILQRSADPVFYRKSCRIVLRRFRSFSDTPRFSSIGDLGSIRRAVIVIAHPDDETFTGGLICELVSLGCEVEVVCLTRGEGGPTGQWTRGELGVVRTGEMEKACNVLGVKTLTFLDHIDPVGGQYRVFAPDVSTKALVRQILPLIEGADLVVSHGSCGEYWHSAHLLVYSAVKASLAQCQESVPGWMTFMARQPGHRMKRRMRRSDSRLSNVISLSLDYSVVLLKERRKTISKRLRSRHWPYAVQLPRCLGTG